MAKNPRIVALKSAVSFLALVAATPALAGAALPTSGQYVAGSGTIAKKSNGLTINQSSHTGIIDWNSFSIGSKNSVQFNNGSGATLNRVTGGNLSTIAGSLKATGSLYLINPQGVIVTGTGKVLTGGSFVGSSRDESDSDFLNSKRKFSGSSKGNVTNEGTISSANGDVTLIGSSVTNSGTMSAKNGSASLNAGNDVLLAPSGSNGQILISGGKGDASNSGTIAAAQDQLNAAGGNVYALSGNNGGIIRALGTKTVDGHVWLTSSTGNVTVAGTLTSTNADGSGGAVTARASNITFFGNVDASATKATMLGGNVSIVAANTTKLSGTIAAKGGAHGAGGQIETSGEHVHVADSAKVSTLAQDGLSGDWVIDPTDFIIAASGGDITGAALSTQLATTNVTIKSSNGTVNTSGNGDIFVNDAVSWSSNSILTLDAYRSIDVNAVITASGGLTGVHTSVSPGIDLIDGDQSQNGSGNPNIGNIIFGSLGRIADPFSFLGHTYGSLTINGNAYTFVSNISQLVTDIANKPSGYYALADNYDASADGTYAASPIATTFTGNFEGLGNTVSNLAIDNMTADANVGLFSDIGSAGVVRDIEVKNANIVAGGAGYVGPLAGRNDGLIFQDSSSGTIDVASESDAGGLVGYNDGAIRSSYAAGAVTGGDHLTGGGLVGFSTGSNGVGESYATGTVIGGENSRVGGLIGDGSNVLNSFATGAVVAGDASEAGGLIGFLEDNEEIEDSYATGAVSAGNVDSAAGGLVGDNHGMIENSYSLSAVRVGSSSIGGGLVGVNESSSTIEDSYAAGRVSSADSGSAIGGFSGSNLNFSTTAIAASYWDSQTSGQSIGIGNGEPESGLVGETTSQLQSGLPGGFNSGAWKIIPGTSLPYLAWQFASGDTPEVVSGTISGAPSDAGLTVHVRVDGTYIGPGMTSGANGYYYELLTPGTISSSGSDVLAYLVGSTHANRVEQNATGSLSNFDLSANHLTVVSSATSLTALNAVLKKVIGTGTGSSYLFAGSGSFTSGITLDLDLSAASFNLDKVLNIGTGTLDIDASGVVSQTASGLITAKTLTGSSVGATELNAANTITNLGAFTTGGNHTFELTDAHDLTVTGAVTSGSQNIHLTTTGSGHDIFVQNALTTSGSVYLVSAATIYDSGAGKITANKLTGSSIGATELNDANVITDLGAFTTGGNHTFELTDAHDLTVTGPVTSGSQNIHLTTTGSGHDIFVQNALTTSGSVYLVSAATISESGAGVITANKLTGSSVGATDLNEANVITDLGAFATGGNHNFELVDAHDLTVTGAVNAGTHDLDLTTTGNGHDIAIDAMLTAGTINLVSAGKAAESSAGAIVTDLLNVTAQTGITLTSSKNAIKKLGTDKTTSGTNKVTL